MDGRWDTHAWGQELGEIGKNKFCNIAQFFAIIEKAGRGGNHKGRQRELGVEGMGSTKNSDPPPPSMQIIGK